MARYIDVKKLLKDLTSTPDGTKIPDVDCDNFPVKIDLRLLKRIILRQPAADVVKVKHGEWIHEPPYYAPNGKFLKGSECSNCHSVFVSDANEAYSDHPWCCECGAKMDGGKAE